MPELEKADLIALHIIEYEPRIIALLLDTIVWNRFMGDLSMLLEDAKLILKQSSQLYGESRNTVDEVCDKLLQLYT